MRDGVDSPDTFAGIIFVQATGVAQLNGIGSAIFSSVGSSAEDAVGASANSGIVLIQAGSVEIDGRLGGAGITTSNFDQGGAGSILIESDTDVIVRGRGGIVESTTSSSIPIFSTSTDQEPGLILIEAQREE